MHRTHVLAATALLLATACGLKVPVPTSQRASGPTATDPVTGEEIGTEVLGDQITPDPSGSLPPGTTARPRATARATATTAATAGGGATATPTPAPSGTSTGLFASETAGVTDGKVTICSHAPLTGAAPIARDPNQTSVYWSWLNDNGKLNGRTVEAIVYDDRYTPDGAIAAAERCKGNAFLLIGPAGVDQITEVAKWAAREKVPYLHGSASTRSIGNNPYQFFLAPDYEYQHVLLADYVTKVLKKAKVAQVALDSPHFEAGSRTFKDRLAASGVALGADLTVANGQQSFANVASQIADAEVVNNFTNPLTWVNMLLQLGQTLRPTWIAVSPVAGQNLIVQNLGAFLGDGGAQVFYAYPAFRDDPANPEIQRFLDAFVRYTGKARSAADDVDWLAWLANRQVAQLMSAAGRDLTRSALVLAAEGFKQSAADAAPACPLDFTRDSSKRRGSWSLNVFRSSGTSWTQTASCADHF